MNRIPSFNASINQLLKQFTNPVLSRNASNKSFLAKRQSKTLNKLLTGKAKSRKVWRQEDESPKLQSITSLTKPASSSLRRVNVLNKLFMRHITDYMATDGLFTGHGLEISRVQITTDFRLVNVYWSARGDVNSKELESLLANSAGLLRHNLSQLRLMGEVPVIKFVKDKLFANSAAVESLLKVADFGDDFVPTSPAQRIRNDLSRDINQPNVLPEMTHDVLGLNHSRIMNCIKANMTKAKQAWEKYETKLPASMEEMGAVAGDERKTTIIRLKEEELQEFLIQRNKNMLRHRWQRDYAESEDFDDDDINQIEERDTFVDDFDIKQ